MVNGEFDPVRKLAKFPESASIKKENRKIFSLKCPS